MSNIIDSIQLSGVTYTIQGSGGGGVPESAFTAYTAATDARIAEDEEVTAAGLNAINDRLSEDEEVTAAALIELNEAISGVSGNNVVELTQAEYDALVDKDPTAFYIITDATPIDISNYWTSAQTQSAITSAVSTKQDQLVSGTNIKTINNESILGSGNIDIQGGGKAVSGGTNISITTGETADTINCTLPISGDNSNIFAGYAINNIYSNKNIVISTVTNYSSDLSKIDAKDSISIGQNTILSGNSTQSELSVAIGNSSKVYGVQSTALGVGCNASGNSTLAIGRYTTSKGNDSVAIGNQANVSGNSSVAIGRLAKVSGDSSVAIGSGATANGVDYKTNINNQLTIDTSNQVYISNSANTSTYCLQEKIENTEAALGGLKLVKLTQAEYNALATKDSNTLYIIT